MSDPLVPNYKSNIGRLVTDRYDFQKHIDGNDFRHQASTLDLFPTVVINGDTRTTVQDAIEQLALNLTPPTVADATTTVKGIIKLAGDIGGASTNILVTRIQGKPVSNLAPTTNNVLSWDGSAWTPTDTITLAGLAADIAIVSTSFLTSVAGITDHIAMTGATSYIQFSSTNTIPTINCEDVSSGDGNDFSISGQGTSDVSANGGNIFITAGGTAGGPLGGSIVLQGGSGTLNGGTQLALGDGSTLLHATQIEANRRVLGLVSSNSVDSTQMPSNSGDMVVYLANAATNPTNTVSPVDGAILYASGGSVHVRQSDNLDITLGPESWGRAVGGTSGKMETYSAIQTTTDATSVTLTSFSVPAHTSIYVEAWVIGKQDGVAASYSAKLSGSYAREAGSAVEATVTDGYMILTNYERIKRVTPDTDSWTSPSMTLSGSTITIASGHYAGTTITWFTVVKIITAPSASTP